MKILKLKLGDFINFIYIIVALGSPVIHAFIFFPFWSFIVCPFYLLLLITHFHIFNLFFSKVPFLFEYIGTRYKGGNGWFLHSFCSHCTFKRNQFCSTAG